MSIEESPFQISISDTQISRLKEKLALTTFPDELDGVDWKYGVPLAEMQRLVAYWQDGYDWRAQEAKINKSMPQFTKDVEVDGFGPLNIHYVHKKSALAGAIPLVFVHGWPGSFLEVERIVPLLTEPEVDGPSFHVVALSLPGFGFSEAPKKQGFNMVQYCEVINKLMCSLGYNEYVSQGGDWGGHITTRLAKIYGHKHVKAWHTNYPVVLEPPTFWRQPISYLTYLLTPSSPHEKVGLQRMEEFQKTGRGYNVQQSTQPQTLGYSLTDSPSGLLAWIYEKMHNWTDDYPWTDDEILTWISVYWFSRAGPAASLRIYYEFHQSTQPLVLPPAEKPTIPMGVSRYPKELRRVPKTWLVNLGNLVYLSKEHEHGGHFAAHETPDALVGELREMFGKGGPAFGVVPRKNGY